MTDHGDHTQDLRRHTGKTRDPDTLEARTRRFGLVNFIVGLSLCVATVVESLGMAAATEHGLFRTGTGQLFGLMGFVAQMMIGGFLILLGAMEHRGRPVRERDRRIQLLVERLTIDHRERYENLVGLVAALPGRVADLERAIEVVGEALKEVPNYGRGVIDGVQMRQDALGGETTEGPERY